MLANIYCRCVHGRLKRHYPSKENLADDIYLWNNAVNAERDKRAISVNHTELDMGLWWRPS